MYINKNTMMELNSHFGFLPPNISQDWEIEFADKNRILEFLEFYNSNLENLYYKHAVMSLILFSVEDLLQNDKISSKVWLAIKNALLSDYNFFEDLILYWCQFQNEIKDDLYALSNFMRIIYYEHKIEKRVKDKHT